MDAPIQPRVPYSVVAVDGGADATPALPTYTVTHTAAETKTVDKTETITAQPSSTSPVTITAIPSTVVLTRTSFKSVSEPSTLIASAIPSNSYTEESLSTTTASVTTTLSPTNIQVSIQCSDTTTALSQISTQSNELMPTSTFGQPSFIPAVQVSHIVPPNPTTQTYGSDPMYSAWKSWNITSTSRYGSTGTNSATNIRTYER
ncbi:MAG: hypothetical protein Q9190_001596 [Brigantiaea leucoxantha]